VLEDGESETLASDLQGVVAFAWSPDGRYIAYTEGYRSLIVLDALTGDVVTQAIEEGVFAFFWSPNSESLAFITLSNQENTFSAKRLQQANGLAWSVIDVASGQERHFGAFYPTDEMLYVLSYFDQFAQSHRVWSPDSRYLVYSEINAEGDALVRVLDTTQDGAEPQTLAEGTIGIWSFE
jgi:TolB protein